MMRFYKIRRIKKLAYYFIIPKTYLGCFILLLLNIGSVNGQGLRLSGGIGKVIKHKETLLFNIPPQSGIARLSYIRPLGGDKDWHRYWGMPVLDYSFAAVDFGDQQVLGHAVALMAGIHYKLIDRSRFQWVVGGRSGVAYLTKVYNRIDNLSNNAIGAHINNATNLSSSLKFKLTDRWSISQDMELIHFSNGRTKSPNSGINVWTAGLSLYRSLGTKKIEPLTLPELIVQPRFGFILQSGLGKSQQRNLPGGPTYRVFNLDLLGYWQFARYQRMILGVGYEHNDAIYAFNLQIFAPDDVANTAAKDVSLMIGDELQFGPFCYRFILGYYLNIPSDHVGEDVYLKIGVWYLPKQLKYRRMQPFIGIQMKSHFAIAESLSIYTGVKF